MEAGDDQGIVEDGNMTLCDEIYMSFVNCYLK